MRPTPYGIPPVPLAGTSRCRAMSAGVGYRCSEVGERPDRVGPPRPLPGRVAPTVAPGSSHAEGFDHAVARVPRGKQRATADGSYTVDGRASNGEGSL